MSSLTFSYPSRSGQRFTGDDAQDLGALLRLAGPASRADTVSRLCVDYARWAFGTYVKAGRPTRTASNAAMAAGLLCRAGLAEGPAAAFGPKLLRRYQAYLGADPRWARRTINEYVRHVVAMFQWAVAEERVPAATWQALRAVRPLQRGRPAAPGLAAPRDGGRRRPAPEADLQAVLAIAPPMLRAMLELQLLTAMRPSEMLWIRRAALFPTVVEGVWCYRVPAEANKCEHLGIERQVFIGPRGMEILEPWLPEDPEAFAFSPRRAEQARHAERRETRRTPRWPSHRRAQQRRRTRRPRAAWGERYTPDSYRRALERLCARAGVAKISPYQLRHNAATVIAARESIDVAQLVLGHRDITTTVRYARVGDRRLITAAAAHG